MIPIGVITNIYSGANKKGKHKKKLLKKIFQNYAIVEKTSRIDQISVVLERFKEQDVKILCIDGGDGTIQKVMTEWIKQNGEDTELPFLIPLRGGTSNATAHDFGIKGDATIISKKVMEELKKFERGEISQFDYETRNLLKIQASFHPAIEYGFIMANGIVYKAIKKYQDTGDPSLRTTFSIIAETVMSALLQSYFQQGFFDLYNADIIIDGVHRNAKEFIGVLASALNRLFFHITPFHPETFDKKGFNFAALSLPANEAARHAFELFRGHRSEALNEDVFFNDRVNEVLINSSEGMMIDGELFHNERPGEVKIFQGPEVKILKIPDVTFTDHLIKWKDNMNFGMKYY